MADEQDKGSIEMDSKFKSVDDLIEMVLKDDQSHRAGYKDDKGERNLEGPLFTFLVGAGFSADSGIPMSPFLVNAMKAFLAVGNKRWTDIFNECKKSETDDSGYKSTIEYFKLMDALGGPIARHSFLSALIQWAMDPENQPTKSNSGIENKLLAAILINGTRGDFEWNDPESKLDNKAPDFLHKNFAQHVFTTNFDDILPLTFSKGLLPLDVIDGPALHQVRIPATFPTLAYLHGRYLHYDLRNTYDELLYSKPIYNDMFDQFRDNLRNTGLIVVGYSGAEDRVMRCIEEALDDPDSLRFSLWWCVYDSVSNLHPHVRKLVENHPRAYYLINRDDKNQQIKLPASDFMKDLSAKIGLNVSSVTAWWDTRDKKQSEQIDAAKGKRDEEIKDPKAFCALVKDAVDKGSPQDISKPLLDQWEGMLKIIENLKDKVLVGSIKRYVGILMLHYASFEIGKGNGGEDWMKVGEKLLEEAKSAHQEAGSKFELAGDHLHLGAYQSKRKTFERDHFGPQTVVYDESKSNLVKAKKLYLDLGKKFEGLSTDFWLARLEIYLGDKEKGCRQLRELLPRAKAAKFQSLVDIVESHIRKECR